MTGKTNEEQQAEWRRASKLYYDRHYRGINLWKAVRAKARRRGIFVPKLNPGDLMDNSPMDLLQKLRLPADLITDKQWQHYLKLPPRDVGTEEARLIACNSKGCSCNLDEQNKCKDDAYVCKCGCDNQHGD